MMYQGWGWGYSRPYKYKITCDEEVLYLRKIQTTLI